MTSAQSPVAALEVCSLCAGYPGTPRAIDGLSFTLQPGECVALVGPNGAGKSTLLRSIAGLQPFGSGKISVHGHDCRSSHAQVGHVPQRNTVDWHFPLSARDVVLMGRARNSRWLPWWPRRERERVDELLHLLRLESLANSAIGELSTGQQQRVFIARALAQEAEVLLLDEPLNGVDVAAAAEITATLGLLRERGITLLLATHNLGHAARDFERVLLLRRTLLADGAPAEVLRAELLQRAYGDSVGVLLQRDGTLLVANEHSP